MVYVNVLTHEISGLCKYSSTGNICPMKMFRHKEYLVYVRRVSRYQRGNQNPYIEEEETTQ